MYTVKVQLISALTSNHSHHVRHKIRTNTAANTAYSLHSTVVFELFPTSNANKDGHTTICCINLKDQWTSISEENKNDWQPHGNDSLSWHMITYPIQISFSLWSRLTSVIGKLTWEYDWGKHDSSFVKNSHWKQAMHDHTRLMCFSNDCWASSSQAFKSY